MRRARSGWRAVAPFAWIAFVACNALLGNEDEYTFSPRAKSCILPSDCDNGNVCIFQTCSPECVKDIDCPVGSRCLETEGRAACVTASIAACRRSECPLDTVCRDGQCRRPCEEGVTDCRDDQTCVLGVCIGKDRSRDPGGADQGSGGTPSTGGGGNTPEAGAGAMSTGGSNSSGGSSAEAGASGDGGTSSGGDGSGGEGGAEPCVPRGAEDCLNGVDDDCNGQIDCADEACKTPTDCVPEARGAELGTLLPMGSKCPAGFTAVTLHRDLNDPGTCDGCSCRPTAWRCQSGVYGHGTYPCPGFQFMTPLYNLFTGQCNAMPADPNLHFYPVSGFTECAAEGTGVPGAVSWGETYTFCRANRVGGGCPKGQSCVSAVSTASCAMSAGEKSCGSDYPDDSGGVFNTGFSDDRTCTCSCSFGSADCTGGYIEAFSGGACTGTSVQLGNGGEGDACPLAITPQSARIVATPTAPSCPPNAFPFGEVTPTDPRTVCCQR